MFFSYLLNPATGRLRLNACGGVDKRIALLVEGLELSGSLCGTAVRNNCRVLEENLTVNSDACSEVVRDLGVRAYCCHPLRGPGNAAFGTLSFGATDRDVFSEEDLALMKTVTDYVAVAMLRKRTEEALRGSEECYRTVIENSLTGIALRQGDNLLFANQAFCDMLGRPEKELLTTSAVDCVKFLHPDDRQTIFQRHLDRIAGKEVPSRYEYRYIHKDGSIVWVDALAQSIWINGQAAQLGMYVDITERKRAEAALQKSLAEKEVLLREIHHRVKNNMQTVIGLLRMQARRIDNAQLTEIFTDCRDRIGAMSLIHEALYQSENLAEIDFEAYLKKLCRNLGKAHDAQRKGITLTTSAADVSMNMDQGVAVGMIIAELISNAFKHAFPDGEGGAVSVHLDRPDGETVRLIVSDTGIGLPEDFDIRNPRSLGMRLVSGAVIRELGGSIEATSDGGAEFVIRFKCEEGKQTS
jgi:PAS domain S-box-containing protein